MSLARPLVVLSEWPSALRPCWSLLRTAVLPPFCDSDPNSHGALSPPRQAILRNQSGVPQATAVLTLSPCRWHCLPQVEAPVLQGRPPFRHHYQAQIVTGASEQLAVDQRFPQPSRRLQFMLWSGSQSSETSYLSDDCFLKKGHNLGTAG